MRLLDLFCCAGGAGQGYKNCGFEITGVDIKNQKRNPHNFIQMDVFDLNISWIRDNFDLVHASPPCQGYTALRHSPNTKGSLKLIGKTREFLKEIGLPYVIENVEDAKHFMINPILLCGTMFGLKFQEYELRRHRLFESSFDFKAPNYCSHSEGPVIGVYGGHARCRSAKHGGRKTADVWKGGHKEAASKALGITWMTLSELSEAIPPAFTEHIGKQAIKHFNQRCS